MLKVLNDTRGSYPCVISPQTVSEISRIGNRWKMISRRSESPLHVKMGRLGPSDVKTPGGFLQVHINSREANRVFNGRAPSPGDGYPSSNKS
ncbi:hypothetical protein EYF80_005022 [Liparis tanakae]|uniref:Uncharacterized protein n=1 Tax=Liparis tanakae TaxID=230148 RepID=A0A4Z2J3L6_9TELE|nr:hypothetical protein EYF80_005022 [Liparis tanakae]